MSPESVAKQCLAKSLESQVVFAHRLDVGLESLVLRLSHQLKLLDHGLCLVVTLRQLPTELSRVIPRSFRKWATILITAIQWLVIE